ncbi:MAG: hypothetical protein GWP08_06675 [Nitrospiraceae bacterium]|nr:hypothetical protein [Nitrospiraceae bacterium]
MLQRGAIAGAILAVGALGASAWACDVPVYRYAMDNWEPDRYDLVVFHRGPLTPEQEALVTLCKDASEPWAVPRTNLNVVLAGVDAALDPALRAVWEAEDAPETPWLALRYPHAHPQRPSVWSGALSEPNVKRVLDSPKRRELVRRLSEESAAVWVQLDTGDVARDDAALQILQSHLTGMADETSGAASASFKQRELQAGRYAPPSFGTLRLSRTDPAETALVAMLLGTEPDLMDYDEPMVFPVFGRGRALYAIVGKGINKDNIREAALFLATACSCLVKADNPGTDLLLSADWTAAVSSYPEAPQAPPAPVVDSAVERSLAEAAPERIVRYVVVALVTAFAFLVGVTCLLAIRRPTR